jgi:hypothetical protein
MTSERGDADEIIDPRDTPSRCAFDENVQEVTGRTGIIERSVTRSILNAESLCQGPEAKVSNLVTQQAASKCQRVDNDGSIFLEVQACQSRAQEPEIERGIVSNEDGISNERSQTAEDLLDTWCGGENRIGQAGDDGDSRRNCDARINQSLKCPKHLPAPNLDRPDLTDEIVSRVRAGGLEVDDAERRFAEGRPKIIEAPLPVHHMSAPRTDVRVKTGLRFGWM